MFSPTIEALRSVSLDVPDLALAEMFYTQTWKLEVAHRSPGTIYLRGTGADAYLLSLHAAQAVGIRRHEPYAVRSPMASRLATKGGLAVTV